MLSMGLLFLHGMSRKVLLSKIYQHIKGVVQLSKKYLGIDFGTYNIKIAGITVSRDSVVLSNPTLIRTPGFLMQNGRLADREGLKEVLVKALADRRHESKDTLIVLNDQMVITRDMEMPPVGRKELGKMVRLDASEYLPSDVSEYTIRHKVLSQHLQNQKNMNYTLASLARTDLLMELCEMVDQIGRRPKIIDVAVNSMFKYAKREWKKAEIQPPVVAMLDLGAGLVKMVILRNGIPAFQQTIPHSSQRMDVMISNTLGIERTQAEELKTFYGLEYMNRPGEEEKGASVASILSSQINLMLNDIYKHIQNFMSRNEYIPVNEIWLTGGMAEMKGLSEYIQQSFSIKCRVVQTGKMVSFVDASGENCKVNYFTNLIGAAVREE